MGKFNLKTHSDSIVSFLTGNMQNKSAAEIVQDAAGNLHPFGLHDEDPQQEQGIPAPRGRDRGCGTETPALPRAGSGGGAGGAGGGGGGGGVSSVGRRAGP